jgi:hypothetical protein
MEMEIKFTRPNSGSPHGKLADAELYFIGDELDGLKLIGFTIWASRGRNKTGAFHSQDDNTESVMNVGHSRY